MINDRLFFIGGKNKSDIVVRLKSILKELNTTTRSLSDFLQEAPHNASGIRLLILVSSTQVLKEKIEKSIEILLSDQPYRVPPKEKIFITNTKVESGKTLFLFPGFGSEFPSMLTGIDSKFDCFSVWEDIFKQLLQIEDDKLDLAQTDWLEVQLQKKKIGISEAGTIGSVASLVFHDILNELGIKCEAMVGHSNGENAALISSGLLSYGTRSNLVEILQSLSRFPEQAEKDGTYLLVSNFSRKNSEILLESFPKRIQLAMMNCPGQQVYYVKTIIIDSVKDFIKKRFGLAFELMTDHPYHTTFFQNSLNYLKPLYSRFKPNSTNIPVYSCVTSSKFPSDEKAVKELAIRQWVETVDFQKTIENAYEDGFRTFIEVGPNNKLSGFVLNTLKGKNVLVANCSKEGVNVIDSIFEMCAKLWVNFRLVDLSAFSPLFTEQIQNSQETTRNRDTETLEQIYVAQQDLMKKFLYVNERITKSYINHLSEIQKKNLVAKKIEKRSHLLLNGTIEKSNTSLEYNGYLDIDKHNLIKDHSMGGVLPVLPFTMSLELLAEIGSEFEETTSKIIGLTDVKANKWFDFEQSRIPLKILATKGKKPEESTISIEVYKTLDSQKSIPAFQGKVAFNSVNQKAKAELTIEGIRNQPTVSISDFYKFHLFHGTCFTSIYKIEYWTEKGVKSQFKMPDLSKAISHTKSVNFVIPGPMLDSTGQLMAYWLYEMGLSDYAVFPFLLGKFEQYERFPDSGTLITCRAKIKLESSVVNGDFEFQDLQGNVLGRLIDFKLRFYNHKWIPILLMNNFKNANPTSLDSNFLTSTGGIWKKILAKLQLNTDQYKSWTNKPEAEQIEYLLDILQEKA